jgi:3-deoxy-7-phosphoheptulonate synthase
MNTKTDNLNIRAVHVLLSPAALAEDLPLDDESSEFVSKARKQIEAILSGQDNRLIVIVGPCSIHDTEAGLDYARRLSVLAKKYRETLCIVMRVYFEKPRTRLGWKGLINDPDLDGSYHINKGLHLARKFLLDVTKLELPAATEFLDTTFGQYFSDVISLGAIGARTTESQVHRELASGLSMPIGFKNRTDGNIDVAIDAIIAAGESHSFPTLTKDGAPAIMETTGNSDCFLILRGGSNGPNYSKEQFESASALMQKAEIRNSIIIDCSHGNSEKDYRNQPLVVDNICQQLENPTNTLCGVMIESHIKAGNQKLTDLDTLEYGKSITDGCIDWQETEKVLGKLAAAAKYRMSNTAQDSH